MGAELQSPEGWKGFRAWIPRARLFLEAEHRACHREMSHAQGKGLMDFCARRQLFTGVDLEATEHQTTKGGVGSGLMMLGQYQPPPASLHHIQATLGTLSPRRCPLQEAK